MLGGLMMTPEYMDEDRKKLVELLIEGEINKNEAKCLIFIADKDDVKSKEMEDALDLRQPVVSIAVQELREKGWIEKKDVKKSGKGRPTHAYNIKKPIDEIVNDVIKDIEKEIEELKDKKRELRDLTMSLYF